MKSEKKCEVSAHSWFETFSRAYAAELGYVFLMSGNIADFCRRWQVRELSVFGSVLRPDFRPDSDVDVLVDFVPSSHPTLFDLGHMQAEFEEMLGRRVDLLTRRGVESSSNPYRRESILSSSEVVYAG